MKNGIESKYKIKSNHILKFKFPFKTAQAAVEFLFIIGFAMLLLLPSLALFGRFVEETSYTVTSGQVNKIGSLMLATATQVYQGTNGSSIIIELNFPDGVTNMTILNSQELVFTTDIGGHASEQTYYSQVPLNATFNATDYEKGFKKFRFTAVDSGAQVQIERVVKT